MAAADAGVPGPSSRKFFGQVTFTPSKRGYEQEEVDAFLEQAGHAIERLLQRLRDAETLAGDAHSQIEAAEDRARDAEFQLQAQQGDSGLIQRTLTLAERTAVAAVADAKHRAEEIVQEANLEAANVFGVERQQLEVERQALATEREQLDALRLAIAAESHSLEQVRANLRDRVAALADDLHRVAESPDHLGYHIASPAVPTTGPSPTHPANHQLAEPERPAVEPPAAPQLEAASAQAEAPVPPAMAEPVAAPSVAVPAEAPAIPAPEAPAAEAPVVAQPAATAPVAEPQLPEGWGQPATPPAPPAPTGEEQPPGSQAKSFEAQWEREEASTDPAADQAFAQFFSDKVESDPAQSWILAS